jgi:hypothetical protein
MDLNATLQAHGLYSTEQFVLRLSPENHRLVDEATSAESSNTSISEAALQAYSTYIHETVHWWQHVGSTTGLISSLVYPSQTQTNISNIKEWCALVPAEKPIRGWAYKGELDKVKSCNEAKVLGNTITNNTVDLGFFKQLLYSPDKAGDLFANPYFESTGHCFYIAYGTFLGGISPIIDPDFGVLANPDSLEGDYLQLRDDKANGFYHGSPLVSRIVGMVEIFEGQASFIQMQFLANAFISTPTLDEFKSIGLLHGVYLKAFEAFLELSGLEYPNEVIHPTVGLFLLICDLSINPVDGFPCNFTNVSSLIYVSDPGVRFELLCKAAATIGKPVTGAITDYSNKEYTTVAAALLKESGLRPPWDGWLQVDRWTKDVKLVRDLMHEQESFNYQAESIVMRVMLSHFISFTLDKLHSPEFFCWTGMWLAGPNVCAKSKQLFLKHLSLFSDKENDDAVFPRKFPDKNPEALMSTFHMFFGSTAVYDLTRQWILKDGPFDLEFSWLSSTLGEKNWREWADQQFVSLYGLKLSDISLG